MRYSETFKEKMVQKMAGPRGRSATCLADEVGIPQPTLSRWLKAAGTVPAMAKKKSTKRRTGVSQQPVKRPQDWTPTRKLDVVLEAAAVPEDALGEFLRRAGLHQAQLDEWREQVSKGAIEQLGGGSRRHSKKASAEVQRIRELEKELRRKDKALAEAAALIVLKKKALAIWGDEDDDMDSRSGK